MSKRLGVVVAILVLVAIPAGSHGQAASRPATPSARALPRVVILATGGTIAGVQPREGEPGYRAGSLAIDALVRGSPGVDRLARLDGRQIASIGSQDMTDAVWFELARRANEILASPDVDGIVVTHGTDTMEETGYFLDLVVKSDKPVVLVGSMRPATSASPDGPLNLFDAVAVAADPAARGRGVLVVANDELHSARYVQKTNTTDVQTFVSPGRGPLGEVYYGRIRYFGSPPERHTTTSEFTLDGLDALPRVDIVYAHEGADATMVKAAVAAGARGIVLAGVGDGNATREVVDSLAEAARKGVVVVRGSRVGSGTVRRDIELDDGSLGFVAAMDLNPQKARVLLRLALTRTRDVRRIQRYFDEY